MPLGHFGFYNTELLAPGNNLPFRLTLRIPGALQQLCFKNGLETRCGGTCLVIAPGWQTAWDLKFEASLIYIEKPWLKSEMISPPSKKRARRRLSRVLCRVT